MVKGFSDFKLQLTWEIKSETIFLRYVERDHRSEDTMLYNICHWKIACIQFLYMYTFPNRTENK